MIRGVCVRCWRTFVAAGSQEVGSLELTRKLVPKPLTQKVLLGISGSDHSRRVAKLTAIEHNHLTFGVFQHLLMKMLGYACVVATATAVFRNVRRGLASRFCHLPQVRRKGPRGGTQQSGREAPAA